MLRASCTCPYFGDRFAICKHIWAVILSAEAQAIPLVAPTVALADVEIEPRYPEEHFDGDEALPWSPADLPAWRLVEQQRLARAAAHKPRPPAAPPPWRQLLERLGPSPAQPADLRPRLQAGQLLFVVDLRASAAAGSVVVELMTRDRKLNGDWGKPRAARVTADDIRLHADVAERDLLDRLRGATSAPRLTAAGTASPSFRRSSFAARSPSNRSRSSARLAAACCA